MNRYLNRLVLCWGLFVVVLFSATTYAATVTVVLSDDSAPYHETVDAMEAVLGTEHAVIKVLADKLAISDSALSRSKLLVTVGIKATELIADRGGKTPLLAVLVTEDWFQRQGSTRFAAGGRNVGAIVLEQPLSRQLLVIKNAFPEGSKVGVVVGRKNAGMLDELEGAASAQGLSLVGAAVESESTLVATLGRVLMEADLLLAVPDPDVLNRNTVQSVLMTSYRHRDPVVGYSNSLSRAGAMISLYSTPEQVGRQAGEVALKSLNGVKLSGLLWPKYFSISVNGHVARSLGVNAPSEEALLKKMGGND
jgi:ABC-type uncharacterized transport system substrate-binding protein